AIVSLEYSYRCFRRSRRLQADNRVQASKSNVVGAASDLWRRRPCAFALVERDLETLVLEVPTIGGEEVHAHLRLVLPIENKSNVGLRVGGGAWLAERDEGNSHSEQ